MKWTAGSSKEGLHRWEFRVLSPLGRGSCSLSVKARFPSQPSFLDSSVTAISHAPQDHSRSLTQHSPLMALEPLPVPHPHHFYDTLRYQDPHYY